MSETTNKLVYDMSFVWFTRKSIQSKWDRQRGDQVNQNQNARMEKHMIVGGYGINQSQFYEMQMYTSPKYNSISWKSFCDKYKVKNANLSGISLRNARQTFSYLIQNGRYLILHRFNPIHKQHMWYVYSMVYDSWIAPFTNLHVALDDCENIASILITDEILLISSGCNLYFYFIPKNDVSHPQLIQMYTFKSCNLKYDKHGMCCPYFKIDNNNYNSSNCNYSIKLKFQIILFGGDENKNFCSSFLCLDISLKYDYKSVEDKLIHKLDIKENMIEENSISYVNCSSEVINANNWYNFSTECVMNDVKEPIILIFGHKRSESILLYNVNTKQLIFKPNVKCIQFVILYLEQSLKHKHN